MNNTLESQRISVIDSELLREHWQGHRRLTRRAIEAFPEKDLFTFSIGGMRPFGEMMIELLMMAGATAKGIATGTWNEFEEEGPQGMSRTKEELLRLWDSETQEIDKYWPQISEERFKAVDKAFNIYEYANYNTILYAIDNEIHHRGQGYVYLRALGIEPPSFWER